jgi:hypothetical protein
LDIHDAEIQDLVDAIHELLAPLPANHRRIGFQAPSNSVKGLRKALKA